MYEYYRWTLAALLENDPNLTANFRESVFAAMSFNFGPNVVTREHRDQNNLADG